MMGNVLVPVGWVLLAMGLDLTLLPKRTDEFFSWAIRPPITAGAIGAFYVTGFLLVFMAIRRRVWARARALVPAGVVFSALALVATALHLGKFAFDSPHPVAVAIAWEWVLSYAIVPVLLLVALVPQRRLPGVDPRTGRPPRWVTGSLGVAGAILVGTAVALFVAPGKMGEVWPWALTPLTSRVLGAWSAGFGIAFLWAAWENDRLRAVPFTATLAFIGSFQLLTTIRFGDQVSWGRPGARIYVGVLGAAAVAGGAGWARLRGATAPVAASVPP
jgi:hypothetical protein